MIIGQAIKLQPNQSIKKEPMLSSAHKLPETSKVSRRVVRYFIIKTIPEQIIDAEIN